MSLYLDVKTSRFNGESLWISIKGSVKQLLSVHCQISSLSFIEIGKLHDRSSASESPSPPFLNPSPLNGGNVLSIWADIWLLKLNLLKLSQNWSDSPLTPTPSPPPSIWHWAIAQNSTRIVGKLSLKAVSDPKSYQKTWNFPPQKSNVSPSQKTCKKVVEK